MPANPREHLKIGTHDRRCWTCGAFVTPDKWPDDAQPLGDCTRIRWEISGARQMTHADDVCAKHKLAFGAVGQREEAAVVAGLG